MTLLTASGSFIHLENMPLVYILSICRLTCPSPSRHPTRGCRLDVATFTSKSAGDGLQVRRAARQMNIFPRTRVGSQGGSGRSRPSEDHAQISAMSFGTPRLLREKLLSSAAVACAFLRNVCAQSRDEQPGRCHPCPWKCHQSGWSAAFASRIEPARQGLRIRLPPPFGQPRTAEGVLYDARPPTSGPGTSLPAPDVRSLRTSVTVSRRISTSSLDSKRNSHVPREHLKG